MRIYYHFKFHAVPLKKISDLTSILTTRKVLFTKYSIIETTEAANTALPFCLVSMTSVLVIKIEGLK